MQNDAYSSKNSRIWRGHYFGGALKTARFCTMVHILRTQNIRHQDLAWTSVRHIGFEEWSTFGVDIIERQNKRHQDLQNGAYSSKNTPIWRGHYFGPVAPNWPTIGHALHARKTKDTKICKIMHILRRILQFGVDIISARWPQIGQQWSHIEHEKDTKICKMVHILRRIIEFGVDIISARRPQIGQQWSQMEHTRTPRVAKVCIFFEEYSNLAWALFRPAAPKNGIITPNCSTMVAT